MVMSKGFCVHVVTKFDHHTTKWDELWECPSPHHNLVNGHMAQIRVYGGEPEL